MSKQYNIRWSENDNKELQRAVKNFNAKVKRLEQKYKGTDVIIPEKVTMKQMRDLVNTRRDLKREIKSLQKFTERGSEVVVDIPNTDHNIQLTKWQFEDLKKRASIINRKRTLRRKALEDQELEQDGDSLEYTRGDIGMGKTQSISLLPTHPVTKSTRKHEVNKRMEHYRRESQSDYWHKRDLLMRENYIQGIKENFNNNDVKDIIEAIENMDIEEFKEKLFKNPEDFNTAYPPDDEQYIGYILQLKSMWISEDMNFVPRYHKVKKEG